MTTEWLDPKICNKKPAAGGQHRCTRAYGHIGEHFDTRTLKTWERECGSWLDIRATCTLTRGHNGKHYDSRACESWS